MGFDYPLLFEPVAVPRPWGAGRLCKLYDRACADADQPIGESWDVSTWPTDPGDPNLATVSRIVNGPLAGTRLDLVTEVPVVVKVLDAAEKLSVQTHPVTANGHKDEMWYILHAEPDAYLYCGLKEGVDKNEFCEVIRSGNPDEAAVLDMLVRADGLNAGDYFNVPSGTVHAVGPGVVAFEVSERTQVTYRLFDYNRGRAIHVKEGCEAVLASREQTPSLYHGLMISAAETEEVISRFPTFCVVKLTGDKIFIAGARHKNLITATAGDCRISGHTFEWTITLKQSYTCLVPVAYEGYTIDTQGSGEVLITPLCD